MRTRIAVSVFCLLAMAVTCGSEAAAPVITRSGPNSAHATKLMNVPTADQQLVAANITTGKSNRILVIHASVDDNQGGGAASAYWIFPIVNGELIPVLQYPAPSHAILAMPPPSSGFHGNTMTMTWWVDLDSAGLANLPLNIAIWGSATPVSSVAYVSFSAYTVEK